MTNMIPILLALILLVLGYVYTCYYFNGVKCNTYNKTALRFTRNKIFYLIATLLTVVVLLTLFEKVYLLDTVSQVKLLSLVMIMFPIAVIDYRTHKIPNQLLVIAVVIRVVIIIIEFLLSASTAVIVIKDNMVGAVVIGIFFLLLLLVFKDSIGMGDIKLFAVMGLYQGLWGGINSVFFSLMVSFVLCIGLLLTRKKGRKDIIPFGPSILLGTIIAMALSGM